MVSSELPVYCSQSGRAVPKEGDFLGMSLARCGQLQANVRSGRAGTRSQEVAAPARPPHIQRSQEIATERHGKSRWGRGVFAPCAAPPGGHPRAIASCCGSCPAVAAGAQVPRCPAAVPSCPAGAARRTSFPSFPSFEGLLLVLRTEESTRRCPEIAAQLTSAEPLHATTPCSKPQTPRPDRQKTEDVRKCDQQWGFAPSHVLGVAKSHALCLGLRKSG